MKIGTTPAERRLLLRLTALPTAAGREDAVIAFINEWIAARRSTLAARRDDGGNILVTQRARAKRRRPLLITAHLDHPAFVLRRVVDERAIELEFRGGVHEPYFKQAAIEVFAADGTRRSAVVTGRTKAKGAFPVYAARLARPSAGVPRRASAAACCARTRATTSRRRRPRWLCWIGC
jgi:hypothetical protein